MNIAVLPAACIPLVFCLCTIPAVRSPGNGAAPLAGDDFFKTVPFSGAGSVLFVVNGEKQSAEFDAHVRNGTEFSATMYSSIGTVVGVVTATKDSGTVQLQDKVFHLPLDAPLDTLGFVWTQALTLRMLVTTFCGKVAFPFESSSLSEIPASAWNRREFRTQNKHIGHSVLYDRNLKNIKRITVLLGTDTSSSGNKIAIMYENFSGGFARYITIKAGDLNYFSIRYENIQTAQ
jgi:hypothetical protein